MWEWGIAWPFILGSEIAGEAKTDACGEGDCFDVLVTLITTGYHSASHLCATPVLYVTFSLFCCFIHL